MSPVGEGTGLPAICVLLKSIPEDALAHLFIEIGYYADRLVLPDRPGIHIAWLYRGGAPFDMRTLLADATRGPEISAWQHLCICLIDPSHHQVLAPRGGHRSFAGAHARVLASHTSTPADIDAKDGWDRLTGPPEDPAHVEPSTVGVNEHMKETDL
ncbi:SIP domain-containing protein [Candidatus Corynebacterium faecigallinarum]|uniref:SIP domain-containing protein n=1 Tax=Candidatus Corynebacterium faecigallinarum TaxID=2838528 RepID=UPI003FD3111B